MNLASNILHHSAVRMPRVVIRIAPEIMQITTPIRGVKAIPPRGVSMVVMLQQGNVNPNQKPPLPPRLKPPLQQQKPRQRLQKPLPPRLKQQRPLQKPPRPRERRQRQQRLRARVTMTQRSVKGTAVSGVRIIGAAIHG